MSVRGVFASGAVGLARGSIETFGPSAAEASVRAKRDAAKSVIDKHLIRDLIDLTHASLRVYQKLDNPNPGKWI
jgi:hypothetical protein